MITPLLTLLRALTPEQRTALATLAGTSVGSLYQIAGCHRPNPSANLALRIETASREMNMRHGTPVVTMHELATMCALRTEENK
jgi:hypothetical protein